MPYPLFFLGMGPMFHHLSLPCFSSPLDMFILFVSGPMFGWSSSQLPSVFQLSNLFRRAATKVTCITFVFSSVVPYSIAGLAYTRYALKPLYVYSLALWKWQARSVHGQQPIGIQKCKAFPWANLLTCLVESHDIIIPNKSTCDIRTQMEYFLNPFCVWE